MKKLLTAIFSLCLAMSMAAPSFAYDYTIPEPGDPEYADDTSVEVVYTADGGAAKNEDVSKNAAYVPPALIRPTTPSTLRPTSRRARWRQTARQSAAFPLRRPITAR